MRPHRSNSRQERVYSDNIVIGIHAISELLSHHPKKVIKVYSSLRQGSSRKHSLIDLCVKMKVPVLFQTEDELTRLAGSESHQSFVAMVQNRIYLDAKPFLKSLESKEKSIVLMIDQIFDPQNLGSILRTAECFGVDGVVYSKNRGASITAAATKSSCGASEWLPLVRVSNLAETVTLFAEEGFDTVSSALEENSKNAFQFKFSAKTLLILGSEGEGIQPLILKRSDHLISIPMKGFIQSLNVAQACSSLLTLYNSQNS
jgi:23S rRNA (guanosine2251-2'-O)-methyltransferase